MQRKTAFAVEFSRRARGMQKKEDGPGQAAGIGCLSAGSWWWAALLSACLVLLPFTVEAAKPFSAGHDPVASVIFWVTLIFVFAIFGRYLAKLFHQPGVLGELLLGVFLGNIGYYFGIHLMTILREGSFIFSIIAASLDGVPVATTINHLMPNVEAAEKVTSALSSPNAIELVKVAYVLDMFSRFGVIFLLFIVGLETSISELRHTGRASLQVACIGVIAPIFLGFSAALLLMPNASFHANLFVAATLSATSIGITARVLSEMKKLRTREARTIIGAAMLDDILGLIILAVVSSIVISGQVDFLSIIKVIVLTLMFFVLALSIGPIVLRQAIKRVHFLEPWESKLFISYIFVMILAWLATEVQLSSIIGAFAAGMIINDSFFEARQNVRERIFNIKELISPLEFLLAPLFFMLIGIQVKLESFLDPNVLLIAGGLTVAAIAGKLLSGLGADKRDDRWLIGIGMLPRGEVGLVFASIGKTLGVISDSLFSAIVLMVIITTFIVPPFLKARFASLDRKKAEGSTK